MRFLSGLMALCLTLLAAVPAAAEALLLRNVRVLDVVAGRLGPATDVSVRDGVIQRIAPGQAADGARVIDGRGGTLMPGLIDVHVHMMFNAFGPADLGRDDLTPDRIAAAAGAQARAMLLRGFTAVRDVGGPVWPLKAAIDAGKVPGPRIWPSGNMISQTSGHADLRARDEPSRRFSGKLSRVEKFDIGIIADGRDEVLTAVRENLRMGASQIKISAGGGTSSEYDPLDVTQYTLDEMKAAVEAADDWNTYVTVHAYTPKSVRRAIEAGVKCIEHGQLLDEATLKLMAEKGIWLSGQNLVATTEAMDAGRREKRRPVIEGQDRVWPMAKRLGVKLAWGTDFLFEPDLNAQQNAYILRLKPWFTPAEILKLVTHDNAQLLALSGPRTPYPGRLGVVEQGALADLILVDGNPLANIDLLAAPATKFSMIIKGGEVVQSLIK
ncbi:metal-dependent hydrolase family protein [Sandaracinobacteroides saxicola]|uniref:Amidohydrolase family protein n=1 Tax=Sandaracinobacteroides saxicola TaxID=2759707 RepID=A0A7G5IKK0_9SPHN|nr:amidohydrolase family protein [Sandaracinobacteroides saxicola]QMW23892.1 amidohydrolase family protein [Sandaracinobacteroides saxicola]